MAAAALAIGAGLSAYGSMQAGAERGDAYRADAAAKRAQAAQVEISARRQLQLTQRGFERLRGAQQAAFGSSGVQVGTGSPLAEMEFTAANAMDQLTDIRNSANYRKTSLLTESGYNEVLANQAEDAGTLGALQAGLGFFSRNPYSYDQRRGGV